MRHRRLLITFLILSSAPIKTAVLDARTWTEVGTGRSFEGDLIKIEDGKAVVRREDGKVFRVPLARLSEPDQAFIETATKGAADPVQARTTGATGDGAFAQHAPPVTVKATAIKGKGKDRNAGLEVKNIGAKSIAAFVVQLQFLNADGSIGKDVPHTQSGFFGQSKTKLSRGKTYTIEVTSFFMQDDTASIDGVVTSVDFDDGTNWPAMPDTPPSQNGDDPVSAEMIGVVGSGKTSIPVIACYNYGGKPVKGILYRIEYLDAAGEVVGRTNYGHSGAEKPIMEQGKGKVMIGGESPAEGAVTAQVTVRSVTFMDDSRWKP